MLRSWFAFWLDVGSAALHFGTFVLPSLCVICCVFCLAHGDYFSGLVSLIIGFALSFLSHTLGEHLLDYAVDYRYRLESGR